MKKISLKILAVYGFILMMACDRNERFKFDLDAQPDSLNTDETLLVPHTFKPSMDFILNPERGFHTWIDLLDSSDNYLWVREEGYTLAYANVSLALYRDAPIDQAFLDELKAGCLRIRQAGIKIILRFNYTQETDISDAPLNRILVHIEQLKPFLQENSDVMTVVQAGFIGAWGEWHSSTNDLDNKEARAAILDSLLEAVPETQAIQLRTPMYKVEYLKLTDPLTKAEAFTGSFQARLAHHNDCFLASEDDEGTYNDPVQDWKNYVAQEGRFVPVGGETCKINPPRTDCLSAMEEMKTMHWSFINDFYYEEVLNTWKNQGCYDVIRYQLGYSLVLMEALWNSQAKPGGNLHIELKLQNKGYAAIYNFRPVYLVLSKESNTFEIDTKLDPRFWEPDKEILISLDLILPGNLASGTYNIYLWMPDTDKYLRTRPEYAVQLANENMWDKKKGMNLLGSLSILDF